MTSRLPRPDVTGRLWKSVDVHGGWGRNRTGVDGFAGRFALAGSRTSAFCHPISPLDVNNVFYTPAIDGVNYRRIPTSYRGAVCGTPPPPKSERGLLREQFAQYFRLSLITTVTAPCAYVLER
jgi:hypothetical protein